MRKHERKKEALLAAGLPGARKYAVNLALITNASRNGEDNY
jgi:hypothetical protein